MGIGRHARRIPYYIRRTAMIWARLLTVDNLIAATLSAVMGWLVLSHIDMKTDVATLQVMQVEDKRVNEIVYVMHETLIELRTGQVYIKEMLDASKKEDKD
jgi:hypothetical protein